LRFGAERQDVPGPEPVVAGDGERERAVDPRRLLDRDRVGRHVQARTAVALGDLDPEQTELGQLWHDFARETLGFVPLASERGDALSEKLPETATKKRVMLAELEIHNSQL
jgi:hypothetical protein